MAPLSKPDYPAGVPSKFTPDGRVQPFPGNTIVLHLSPTSPLYSTMLKLYAALAESPLAPVLALLPPESWHMTLFEGVCDRVRTPAFWPRDLPLDLPLEAVTAHFREKLSGLALGDATPPYQLAVTGFEPLEVGIGLRVEAVTADEDARVRGLRDQLAETLRMRFPWHESYGLHLSVAYLLQYRSEEQEAELKALLESFAEELKGTVELGRPEYCTFENMFRFDRVMFLGDNVEENLTT